VNQVFRILILCASDELVCVLCGAQLASGWVGFHINYSMQNKVKAFFRTHTFTPDQQASASGGE
jgi:hypothetical protein